MICQVCLRFMSDQLLIEEQKQASIEIFTFRGILFTDLQKTVMFKFVHTLVHRFLQQLIAYPLFFMTAFIRFLYVTTALVHISCASLVHSSLSKDSSWVKLVGFLAIIWALKSCHKFSMGFSSGLCLCHSRTLISFSLDDF